MARRTVDVVANVLRFAGLAVVFVLLAHIALSLLGANPAIWLTMMLRDAADLFDLGLADLFPAENPLVRLTVNLTLVALIWYLVTIVVVRLVRRLG